MTLFNITYPDNLPISQEIQQLKAAVLNNQVNIICSETGSGKSTQLPKMLLELGLADNRLIGHTQPRRIAAKTLAHRIGQELNNTALVAYKIRFHDKVTPLTKIKLMTDGILLQEIEKDPLLKKYNAIIIDEAHERSLNIDFILGYLKTILLKRPDLKIIITSATIDNKKLSKFFNDAPIINISGKTYPVDVLYQAPTMVDDEVVDLNQAIYRSIVSLFAIELGNVLVFLPGEREIKECINFLRRSTLHNYQILALFSRQNEKEQSEIFKLDGKVKIIITTNVAETSLTIPGIRYVIDSGLARVNRYNPRLKVEQLLVENVAKSNLAQRAGRAGRTSYGICVRLFDEDELHTRNEFADPEIIRSNLANVILKLITLKLGDPTQFPFLDSPDNKVFSDGFKTLFQLGAIDINNKITPLGISIAKIPLDCNLACMLVNSAKLGVMHELLIIVSFLAIVDPRQYPLEYQQQALQKYQLWLDKRSDFISILNLWLWTQDSFLHKKSRKKLIEECHANFLSYNHLREWIELYKQLKELMSNLGFKGQTEGLGDVSLLKYEQIHRALLSGLINNIGQKDLVENFYLGTNAKKFILHPSSQISKSKWVVSANLVYTSRLYARSNAYIEPKWLVAITKHLVKYTYSDAFWDKKRGEVVAMQSTILYGLTIERKKVSYSRIDPISAQEIFIRQGLVAKELKTIYPFIEHNQNIVKQIDELEDKLRFSLIIVEEELFNFYMKQLPPGICDIRSFEAWYKENSTKMKLDLETFIQLFNLDNLNNENINQYPDSMDICGKQVILKYTFNPDSSDDGVTALIQQADLSLINPNIFTWLVPGLIRDKVTYVIKLLPKNIRVQLNPLNESVTKFLEYYDSEQDIFRVLVDYIDKILRIKLDLHYFNALTLPSHLVCHFQVYDKGKLVVKGNNLNEIKQQLLPKSNIKQVIFNNIKHHLQPQIKYIEQKKFLHFNETCLYLSDIYTKDRLLTDAITHLLRYSIQIPDSNIADNELESFVNQSRINLSTYSGEFGIILHDIAKLYQKVKLAIMNHPLNEIILLQLDDLVYTEFLRYTNSSHLSQIPRYLKAILIRLEKYGNNPKRDQEYEYEIEEIYTAWYNYIDKLENGNIEIPNTVYWFKYKIEELRVSKFAQELGTALPVSSKRLWSELDTLPGFNNKLK